jgi:hypothetical protein
MQKIMDMARIRGFDVDGPVDANFGSVKRFHIRKSEIPVISRFLDIDTLLWDEHTPDEFHSQFSLCMDVIEQAEKQP